MVDVGMRVSICGCIRVISISSPSPPLATLVDRYWRPPTLESSSSEASCTPAIRRFSTDDACHENGRGRFRASLSATVDKEYGSEAQCTVEEAINTVGSVLFGFVFASHLQASFLGFE
jgi:hypothetical protein